MGWLTTVLNHVQFTKRKKEQKRGKKHHTKKTKKGSKIKTDYYIFTLAQRKNHLEFESFPGGEDERIKNSKDNLN